MDVDLLRPGTVPISPDTVLWFEFLLNPSLLETHISKPSPDPSPTDLMMKFMTINAEQNNETKQTENETNEVKPITIQFSYRNLALKILSLKVAAYLKWDLELFIKRIPLTMQLILFQDLFFIAMDVNVEIPNVPEITINNASDKELFTLILYHRWVLKVIVFRALNNYKLQPKANNIQLQENNFASLTMNDEIVKKLEAQAHASIGFLNEIAKLSDIKPKLLCFDTFVMLTEHTSEIKQNWDRVISISKEELQCQINYDIAVYHILKEEYQKASCHFSLAKSYYDTLHHQDLIYCNVDKENLESYCLACQIPIEGKQPNLTHQLLMSIKNQYSNIIQILQQDNISREIPQVDRDNLELDIKGALDNKKIFVTKDTLLQIQCLNLVRKVLDQDPLIGDIKEQIKAAGAKGLETLFWAYDGVINIATDQDKKRIATNLLYLVIMGEINGLASAVLSNPKYSHFFSDYEIQELKKEAISEQLEIPKLLLTGEWDDDDDELFQEINIPKRQVFGLEKRLISSYNPQDIRQTLAEIKRIDKSSYNSHDMRQNLADIKRKDESSNSKPLWQINNSWEIPIPLQSVVCSLPDGFLKDYSYILLAKSRELAYAKDFSRSKELINILEKEIDQNPKLFNENKPLLGSGTSLVLKLQKLLSWEKLLIEIYHSLWAWPALGRCDFQALTAQCKQCLANRQATDHVIPRMEIIEYCTVFLLNMQEWDYLISLEKHSSCFEFAAALSSIAKYKGQKFPKDAWEIVLSATRPNREQSQKRSNASSGQANPLPRDPAINVTFTLNRLREETVLNVVISLLSRMHNILRDESSLDLYAPFLNMWPASIPNPKQYNTKTVGEYLMQLLVTGLKYHPHNVSWLRLLGDLNFVLGYHESAMKYYLLAIIVATDYFAAPARNQIDDLVYRRMIKCCAHLQCFTQAVVLCQFLEQVDYALAFKMAGTEQKNTAPNDAMDAYYKCIWDTTILEYLINLHSKRGEHHRKQLAIKVIGLLELNSNNNEEIQKEAANIRKAKFLRALTKQYVL